MHIDTAIKHFGTRAAIADALGGKPVPSAVYQWKRVVPLHIAKRLEEITEGALKVDDQLYDEMGRAVQDPDRALS